jgi:hypothetical protein
MRQYLKSLGIELFNPNPNPILTDIQITNAYITIRQNLTEEPLALTFDLEDPVLIVKVLSSAYEGTGPVLRHKLYIEFHSIKVENYRSINEFISNFKRYAIKLANIGAKIDKVDKKALFIEALASQLPI